MNIIFAGTPNFAAIALAALYDAGYRISLVLTQPDRPAGRGLRLRACPVKTYAMQKGLPVIQPLSLHVDGKYPDIAQQAYTQLQATAADVMIVAAYGLILPPYILQFPRLGCINIHASLLPRWRGAAPIHRCIESGDIVTGITLMQMDEGLDTGPMLYQKAIPIETTDTTGSLHDKLAALGAKMMVQILADLPSWQYQAQMQPNTGITYAKKIHKHNTGLDFHLSAEILARKVRAFYPSPTAQALFYSKTESQILKVFEAKAMPACDGENKHCHPGQVVFADAKKGWVVACGQNTLLRLLVIQKPGGKPLLAEQFLKSFNGNHGQFGIKP